MIAAGDPGRSGSCRMPTRLGEHWTGYIAAFGDCLRGLRLIDRACATPWRAVITGAEVATVAKVGASVTQGVKTALAQSEVQWPNAHEALMELFTILDDWCQVGERSNKVARDVLHARLAGTGLPVIDGAVPQMQVGGSFRSSDSMNICSGYIERTNRDIASVLKPRRARFKPLRRPKRRAAARRTLRSMLRIYCPDLLEGFETAVANRAASVIEYRSEFFDVLYNPQTPVEQLQEMVGRLDETHRGLVAARADLRELIRKSFPVLSID